MTPVSFSESESDIYRLLHVTEGPADRIQVSIALLKPFGTVSRVFSTLFNERYLWKMNISRAYDARVLKRCPDLTMCRINYGTSSMPKSALYKKTDAWPELWDRYCAWLTHERTGA